MKTGYSFIGLKFQCQGSVGSRRIKGTACLTIFMCAGVYGGVLCDGEPQVHKKDPVSRHQCPLLIFTSMFTGSGSYLHTYVHMCNIHGKKERTEKGKDGGRELCKDREYFYFL